MPLIRPARATDAVALAPRLREADRQEIQAALGKEPGPALLGSIEASFPCFCVEASGEPIALYGVVPEGDRRGQVWLVAADAILDFARLFARVSRDIVEALHGAGYDVLWNCADERNTVHLRWLEWTGFTFIARHAEYGAERRPFIEFVRIPACA